jgi:cytochrome c nitrite reductase small subunit
MQDYYDAWSRSSHHAVATCNDCHTPHDSLIAKYGTKALNGWNHSLAFTTGKFHEPIQIGPRNLAIAEHACRDCHADLIDAISTWQPGSRQEAPIGLDPHATRGGDGFSCIRCHGAVGHPLRD